MSKALHKNLKEARKKKGWSRETLARKLSTQEKPITEDMVYNYEHERTEVEYDVLKNSHGSLRHQ